MRTGMWQYRLYAYGLSAERRPTVLLIQHVGRAHTYEEIEIMVGRLRHNEKIRRVELTIDLPPDDGLLPPLDHIERLDRKRRGVVSTVDH